MIESLASTEQFKEILHCSNSRFLLYLKNRNYHMAKHFYPLLSDEDEPVIIFNLSRKLLFINSALEEYIIEYSTSGEEPSLEEVINLFIDPDETHIPLSREPLIIEDLLLGHRFYRMLQFHDTVTIPVLITGAPMFNENGRRVGGVIMLKVLKNQKERGL